jgi:hypothetical protein
MQTLRMTLFNYENDSFRLIYFYLITILVIRWNFVADVDGILQVCRCRKTIATHCCRTVTRSLTLKCAFRVIVVALEPCRGAGGESSVSERGFQGSSQASPRGVLWCTEWHGFIPCIDDS